MDNEKKAPQIIVNDKEAQVVYTNAVNVFSGLFDFQILVGQQIPEIMPDNSTRLVINNLYRLIMSPQHAKVLLMALQERINEYEQNYGRISISPLS